ncbi:DUF402 domain-containing protein [Microbacterium sp. NPDC056052]|uniref:DUF402 domain-containing protein n=1 Tax=Microbacterium sp. NPDC056052 TaxID=3345695 RepID=UPI0035E24150
MVLEDELGGLLPEGATRSDAPDAPRFRAGECILWRYSRQVETARVVRDDDRGLVTWIPSGSARLQSAPVGMRHTREIPLARRFNAPWIMRESTWTGPGVVRVAPRGKPWSVWFFRTTEGAPAGVYVNLELPHRRASGEGGTSTVFSRDLILDLWLDAEHPGSEDVWLKDADELAAAVEQGRFTSEQADAVRSLADAAAQEFVVAGSWPLDEDWAHWRPDAALDEPLDLPAHTGIDELRGWTGTGSSVPRARIF